jgi:phosphatidylserine synthase 2
MFISFLFEMMEYTFTYLQPNFNECWWDHWILDFALCNTGGILLGHAFMLWQDSREYNWVGINDVPTYTGKLSRLAQQFTPRSWVHYEWHMFEDVRRFFYVFFLVASVMVCELDAFFLKFIFRLEPPSPLNVYRVLIWWAVGMVALRDYYAYITDPKIKRLGSTCWVILAVLLTELAVVVKFGGSLPEWQGKVAPREVVYAWTAVTVVGVAGLLYWFLVELPKRKSGGGLVAAVEAAAAPAPTPKAVPAPLPTPKATPKAKAAQEVETEEVAEEEEGAAKPARGRKGKAAAPAAAAGGKKKASRSRSTRG